MDRLTDNQYEYTVHYLPILDGWGYMSDILHVSDQRGLMVLLVLFCNHIMHRVKKVYQEFHHYFVLGWIRCLRQGLHVTD